MDIGVYYNTSEFSRQFFVYYIITAIEFKYQYGKHDVNQERKVDRRIARTRRMLKAALIELILERGLEAISIRDLTERADIGYATFYRHWKSKEELLLEIFLEWIVELEDRLQNQPSHYEEALALFKFIAESRDIFLVACSLPRDHPAFEKAWSHSRELVISQIMDRIKIEAPLDVSINHLMNSTWELIRWWIEEGEHYSPKQMATYQSELIVQLTDGPYLAGKSTIQSSD